MASATSEIGFFRRVAQPFRKLQGHDHVSQHGSVQNILISSHMLLLLSAYWLHQPDTLINPD